jgi:hypothetical protein
MTWTLWKYLLPLAFLVTTLIAYAQSTDSRVEDLARAGKLRAALFFPHFTKDLLSAGGGWNFRAIFSALSAIA